MKDPFDHPPGPLPGWPEGGGGIISEGHPFDYAQDRRRGFAPLHTPYFISLPGVGVRRYITRSRRGLEVTPGVRPLLAMGRPSIS